MKTSFAIACLLNSAVAVRFYNDQMDEDEVNKQVMHVMKHSDSAPHHHKIGFSEAFEAAQEGRYVDMDRI